MPRDVDQYRQEAIELLERLSVERLHAALQTLAGAAAAASSLGLRVEDGRLEAPPQFREKDMESLRDLASIVDKLEGVSQRQRIEQKLLPQFRLREEILEAYRYYPTAKVGRSREPWLPWGSMLDGTFPPMDDTTEAKVAARIHRAWFNYCLLAGVEYEAPSDAELERLASIEFIKTGSKRDKQGLVDAAQRAAAYLLEREGTAKDDEIGATAYGRQISTLARDAHYPKSGATKSYGELGYFFGVGEEVQDAVYGVLYHAFGHLFGQDPTGYMAAQEREATPGRSVNEILAALEPYTPPKQRIDMTRGDVWPTTHDDNRGDA